VIELTVVFSGCRYVGLFKNRSPNPDSDMPMATSSHAACDGSLGLFALPSRRNANVEGQFSIVMALLGPYPDHAALIDLQADFDVSQRSVM
jgi:hypothetical protein